MKNKSFYQSELERVYREHSLRPELYQKVRQSKAYMDKFYSQKVELSELAEAAFMSRYHYVRTFQKMYGLTPRAYLRDLRIAKAKRQLQQSLPVTEVCLAVGYESLPTFSSVFKRCTGLCPRQYQRLNKAI